MVDHVRIDPINLQKIGVSHRNIEALRHVQNVIYGSVLETTDVEKYLFSLGDQGLQKLKKDVEQLQITLHSFSQSDNDALTNKLRALEMMILSQREPEQKPDTALLLSMLNNISSRLDGIDAKLKELEKLTWL